MGAGTAAGSAGAAGWDLPVSGKTGTTEAHRSSGFVGFTSHYAAANYIYDDSTTPTDLCSAPLRHCGEGDLYGGNEPARTWFTAMKPIATSFGEVKLPPTDPRYVDGSAGVTGAQRRRSGSGRGAPAPKGRGLPGCRPNQLVNSSAKHGEVVGTSPSGQTIPGSIITIQVSNGIPPAPPPPPEGAAGCRRRSDRRWWRFRGCRRSPFRCWLPRRPRRRRSRSSSLRRHCGAGDALPVRERQ